MLFVSGLCSLPATAQPGAAGSTKATTYLLPDGRQLDPSKIDSLEQAWGKGRLSFGHNKEDDEQGIIHLIQVTDDMIRKAAEQREADKQALNGLLDHPAPDFMLADLPGKTWSLQALRGKVVVLNFWFTSCPPCIQEMPELNKLTKQYDPNKVVFLAPTFNTADQVRAFQKKYTFDYTILPAAQSTIHQYKISNFPTSLVIDQQGHVKTLLQGGANIGQLLTTAIDSLLK